MVVVFNPLLDVVVAIVLDEFVLLNVVVIVVGDLSQCNSCCRCSSMLLFHSSLLTFLSKTLLSNNFSQRTFVEQLVGGNVVLNVVLIVLLDVEHHVGVEL